MLGFEALGRLALGETSGNNTTNLVASYFTDADTFYSTSHLDQRIYGNEYLDSDTYYTSKITNKLFDTALLTNTQTFYGPKETTTVHPIYYSDADTFNQHQLNLTLYGNLYTDSDTFFAEQWPLYPSFWQDSSEFVAAPSLRQAFDIIPSDFFHNIKSTIFKDGFRRKNPLRRGKKT